MRADPKRAAINTTPSPADNGTRPTFGSMASPPEASSTRPKMLTAEDCQAGHRKQLIDWIVDLANHLPKNRSIEEASAVVESAGAAGRRDSFALAVRTLDEFIGELRRAIDERLIEVPTPAPAHSLHIVPGGKDEKP